MGRGMIRELRVRNFKSLRDVSLSCRRINVIIGEPATGKSNLLEVIGVLSWPGRGHLRDFVRMDDMTDLFYAHDLRNAVSISAGDLEIRISASGGGYAFESRKAGNPPSGLRYALNADGTLRQIALQEIALQGVPSEHEVFKFYRFPASGISGNVQDERYLLPPDGRNLSTIVLTNGGLREAARSIVMRYGLKLVFVKPDERMEFQMELEEGVVVSFAPRLVSDTILRLIFNLAAVESNRDSVVALEEPEAHTFPYYTKYLAERIALGGDGNQFFITTHNPYFLMSVLEKARKDEVAVHVARLEGNQTRVRTLGDEEMEEMMDLGADVFFNLDRLAPRRPDAASDAR
ncbi:MAG: AAA family ATPase [Conexivisphaera sp.]